jgi:hypothetical protein
LWDQKLVSQMMLVGANAEKDGAEE